MRKYKKTKRTYESDELVEITCDLCGRLASNDDWGGSTYQVNETIVRVEVRQKSGTNYPEGGWGTEYIADICPKCFKEKLIPWLESQGCTAKKKDWGW